MFRPVAVLLIASLTSEAAVAGDDPRSVKANAKVLEFVTGRIEDFYFDPAGPPGWPDEWKARFAAMEKLTDTCAFYAALDGLLAQTGVSHFGAFAPRDESEDRARSALRRMKLARIEGRYFVRSVEGPLADAGVRPGHELLDVGGWPAAEFFADGCRAAPPSLRLRLSAPDGTPLELGLTPEDAPSPAPLDMLVTRELEGKVWYLKLRSFGRSYDARAIADAIEKVLSARALILDLRGNPGGIDANMRDLLGHLYEQPVALGSFVNKRYGRYSTARARYLTNYLRTRNQTPVTLMGNLPVGVEPAAPLYRGALFVLVDPYTASAAEMATLALQKTGRAKIVGERTAGAVLAMLAFNLPDGGRLSMPAASFVDERGRSLEGSGVAPDVEVLPSREDLVTERDAPLASALALARRQADDRAVEE